MAVAAAAFLPLEAAGASGGASGCQHAAEGCGGECPGEKAEDATTGGRRGDRSHPIVKVAIVHRRLLLALVGNQCAARG